MKTRAFRSEIRTRPSASKADKASTPNSGVWQSKLHPPSQRPLLLQRDRIRVLLDRGVASAVVLVSAPTGYGKTVALATWLNGLWRRGAAASTPLLRGVAGRGDAGRPAKACWISLEQADDDPARFFACLSRAVAHVSGSFGRATLSLLSAPEARPTPEALSAAFIEDAARLRGRIVLVLDDYHLASSPGVNRAVEQLVEGKPQLLGLVISTREDPMLPLARWRAEGRLAEVRAADLRCTEDETAEFLSLEMERFLPRRSCSELGARAEGWIAALQLAAISMKGMSDEEAAQFIHGLSGRHHAIADYLVQEVLARVPQDIKNFLLRTSILERMDASLCDTVLRTDGSRLILSRMESANLFLAPLDQERHWFRYHQLFREMLTARLRDDASAHEIKELHERAAIWLDRQGMNREAVTHALEAGRLEHAADLVERIILEGNFWPRETLASVKEWLGAIPTRLVRRRPRLLFTAMQAAYVSGNVTTAARLLSLMEGDAWLEGASANEKRYLVRNVAAFRARYAAVKGQVSKAIESSRQALAGAHRNAAIHHLVLPTLALALTMKGDLKEAGHVYARCLRELLANGNNVGAIGVAASLADVQREQGALTQALESCAYAFEIGTIGETRLSPVGFAGLIRAEILRERNELDEAERCMRDSLALLQRGGMSDNLGLGHARLALILQARGDNEGARRVMDEALHIAAQGGAARQTRIVSAYAARLWLAQGAIDRAAEWSSRRRKDPECPEDFLELTIARVLHAAGKIHDAGRLLDSVDAAAERRGALTAATEARALRSLLHWEQGLKEKALDGVASALSLARAQGFVRMFLELGDDMASLLREWYQKASARREAGRVRSASGGREEARLMAYAESLLRAFPSDDESPSNAGEALSPREKEILRLIARGLSNAGIAETLFLSTGTVKIHVHNILSKLEATNRTQAAAKAHALGLD